MEESYLWHNKMPNENLFSKLNYKYTVLGEVQSPGTYFNYENHITRKNY